MDCFYLHFRDKRNRDKGWRESSVLKALDPQQALRSIPEPMSPEPKERQSRAVLGLHTELGVMEALLCPSLTLAVLVIDLCGQLAAGH